MSQYYHYPKDNENQPGAHEGKLNLFILAIIFNVANITFKVN
jgi:hypothetical protein